MNLIRDLRRKNALSQAQLAKICEVTQTAVSQWENGHTAPDTETLALLADYFQIPMEQLLGRDAGERERHLIPVLGYVRAGLPAQAVQDILDYEELTPEMARNGEHFALKIQGDSMLPRFCPGDVVIVRKQPDADSGDIAVLLINGDDATVKKIIKSGAGLHLVPLNPDYETLLYTRKQVEELPVTVLGKVVELRGKF